MLSLWVTLSKAVLEKMLSMVEGRQVLEPLIGASGVNRLSQSTPNDTRPFVEPLNSDAKRECGC